MVQQTNSKTIIGNDNLIILKIKYVYIVTFDYVGKIIAF